MRTQLIANHACCEEVVDNKFSGKEGEVEYMPTWYGLEAQRTPTSGGSPEH